MQKNTSKPLSKNFKWLIIGFTFFSITFMTGLTAFVNSEVRSMGKDEVKAQSMLLKLGEHMENPLAIQKLAQYYGNSKLDCNRSEEILLKYFLLAKKGHYTTEEAKEALSLRKSFYGSS